MKVWFISDPHSKHQELIVPDNIDMVIHAGDAGTYKSPYNCKRDLENGLQWFNDLDIDTKIYVPGNHDTALEYGLIHPTQYKNIEFLVHEYIEIDDLKIFGSPYTPTFFNWAYNKGEKEIKELWKDIPEDLDILITHGPPKDVLDRCQDGYRAGCPHLKEKVLEVSPKIHVFGHIHEEGGKTEEKENTLFINAAVLDLKYNHANNGVIIDVESTLSDE